MLLHEGMSLQNVSLKQKRGGTEKFYNTKKITYSYNLEFYPFLPTLPIPDTFFKPAAKTKRQLGIGLCQCYFNLTKFPVTSWRIRIHV